MSLQDLPVELLHGICYGVATTDLLALSRTATFLHPVAQRLLYRHITVSAISQNLSVVVTLAKRPEIALFVRSFSITTDAHSSIFRSFYRVLAIAMSNMSGLVSLHIFIDSSTSWVLKGNNRTPSVYSRLTRFTCPFSLDLNVREFLQRTPALLELEVDSIPGSHPSPITPLPLPSLPRLNQFIGSPQAAKAVVPGRPLESIYLNAGELSVDDVSSLANATASVIVLEASTLHPPVLLLESLARHLPSLAFLRITTTYTFPNAPDVEFYESMANSLASFPDLTAFELSGMHWGSRRKGDDGGRRVWQSAPLHLNHDDNASFDSEVFLAY